MAIIDVITQFGPALAALGGLVGGSKLIHEGQRGIKLRFGKAVRTRDGQPKVIRPGFVFVVPGIEQLVRIHVRTRTVNLPTQEMTLADKTVFHIGGVVRCKVIDSPPQVYAALFETDEAENVISDYVTGVLRQVVASKNYEQALARAEVAEQVHTTAAERLNTWGFTLEEVSLSDCAPTEETARAMLLATVTDIRATALAAAASKLAGDSNVRALAPTVAAALIGTPVAAALGAETLADE